MGKQQKKIMKCPRGKDGRGKNSEECKRRNNELIENIKKKQRKLLEQYYVELPVNYYRDGIESLQDHQKQCIEVEGNIMQASKNEKNFQ